MVSEVEGNSVHVGIEGDEGTQTTVLEPHPIRKSIEKITGTVNGGNTQPPSLQEQKADNVCVATTNAPATSPATSKLELRTNLTHSPSLFQYGYTPSELGAAVTAIQKTYRGYSVRRHMKGHSLTPDERWTEALRESLYRIRNRPVSKAEKETALLQTAGNDGTKTAVLASPPAGESAGGETRQVTSGQENTGEINGASGGLGQNAPIEFRRSLAPSRDRWARAAYIARLVQKDNPESDSSSSSSSSDSSDDEGYDDTGHKVGKVRKTWMEVFSRDEGYSGDASGMGISSGDEKGSRESKLSKSELKRRRNKKLKREKAARVEGAKALDAIYYLELVDLKHRYGANLKVYHDYWKTQDTREDFFYWLDYGEGRSVELSSCSRQQLETERVRYLSREERQAYLVKIDPNGRLCWAKNSERIDTTKKFKNSKHGVVPLDSNTSTNHHHAHDLSPPISPTSSTSSSSSSLPSPSSSSSTSIGSGSSNSTYAAHYTSPPADGVSHHKRTSQFSPAHLLNRLLRKTTKKNTWIFVADTSFRLYVGIKESGAFQHSSFLQGARVSAAGLIRIKNGKLKSLSPLSGHYRPPTSNFRKFVRSLKDAGVDMSSVRISNSYAVLTGLEGYSKLMKGKKKAKNQVLDKVGDITTLGDKQAKAEKQRKKEEKKNLNRGGGEISKISSHNTEGDAREDEKKREENKLAVNFMKIFGIDKTIRTAKVDHGHHHLHHHHPFHSHTYPTTTTTSSRPTTPRSLAEGDVEAAGGDTSTCTEGERGGHSRGRRWSFKGADGAHCKHCRPEIVGKGKKLRHADDQATEPENMVELEGHSVEMNRNGHGKDKADGDDDDEPKESRENVKMEQGDAL